MVNTYMNGPLRHIAVALEEILWCWSEELTWKRMSSNEPLVAYKKTWWLHVVGPLELKLDNGCAAHPPYDPHACLSLESSMRERSAKCTGYGNQYLWYERRKVSNGAQSDILGIGRG